MPIRVRFVEDAELPAEVDWAIARDARGRMFFVKASKVCPEVLSEAWAASLRFEASHPPVGAEPRAGAS
jgi:hypothetical protein